MCKTFFGVKRLCTLALCCMAFVASYADVNPKPFVIPEIQSWKGAEGQFVPSGRIVVKGGPKAKAVAQLFASDYKAMFGKTLIIVSGKASKGDFVIQLKNNKKMGSEEYALDIAETATITASTEQALIWGTRTILQISDKIVWQPEPLQRNPPKAPIWPCRKARYSINPNTPCVAS